MSTGTIGGCGAPLSIIPPLGIRVGGCNNSASMQRHPKIPAGIRTARRHQLTIAPCYEPCPILPRGVRPVAYRKVRIVLGLVAQDPSTKALVVPSAAQVYLADKTTVATIYSNVTGTALTNSPGVPTGVTVGNAGLDAYGNLVFYGDVGVDYYALVNGVFAPEPVTGIHGKDFTDHVDGTISDPHGDRQWALETFAAIGSGGSSSFVWTD